jgi:hypothetical protein
LGVIGRTKSGRLITTAELNQNILLVQRELVKLTMAVESNLVPSTPEEESGPMDSCGGCVIS